MDIFGFLAQLFSLLVLLFNQYFSAQAAAKARDEKFKLDQANFESLVQLALTKMRWEAKNDSGQAGNLEDQIDEDLARRKKDSEEKKP